MQHHPTQYTAERKLGACIENGGDNYLRCRLHLDCH